MALRRQFQITEGIVAFFGLGLLAGCASVHQEVYLAELNTSRAIDLPAVHLNIDAPPNNLRAIFHATAFPQGTIEGFHDVNRYSPSGPNLHWNVPSSAFGVDFDYTVSRGVALTFGANWAPGDNESFWGGNAGLGFLFGGEAVAGRLDGGIRVQSLSYHAPSVVVTTTQSFWDQSITTSELTFDDAGRSTPVDFFGALTLNSKSAGEGAKFFVQLSLSRQSLADFHPSHEVFVDPFLDTYTYIDERATSRATILAATPGIWFDLSPSSRLMVGVRVAKEVEIEGMSPDVLLLPLLQFDFGL